MALDTVSLSDIGQSLVAIEAEIKSNQDMISYYKTQIADLYNKNDTLTSVSRAILLNALPCTVMNSDRSPI